MVLTLGYEVIRASYRRHSCTCNHVILLYFAFPAAHQLPLPLRSAETLTLCGDKFTSSIQVSSRFNQLALFTKRSQTAFNWVPNRTRWYWIQSAGKTSSEIQDVKISIENVWTHQSLNGFLPLLWICWLRIDHPLFLNFITWEAQDQ